MIITCFLEGYDLNTKEVKMHEFDDFDVVKFQFAMVDIRATLHLPTNGTPLTLEKVLKVVLDIISTKNDLKSTRSMRFAVDGGMGTPP